MNQNVSPSPKTRITHPGFRIGSALAAVAVAVAVVVGLGLAWAEAAGWPFLAAPLERQLSSLAHRALRFTDPAAVPVNPSSAAEKTGLAFSIRFFGGVKLRAPGLWLAEPAWSQAPYTLQVRDFALDLRYIDLWRAFRGQGLRVQSLQASSLNAQLERLIDGRASWQFRPNTVQPSSDAPLALPSFGTLQIGLGSVSLDDALLDLSVQSELTWAPDQLNAAGASSAPGALVVKAKGHYKKLPLVAELRSAVSVDKLTDVDAAERAAEKPFQNAPGLVPSGLPGALTISLRASVGRAKLKFDGSSASAFSAANFAGRFEISGPSLAAVGDPVGVTLPTTGAFRSQGRIVRQSDTWYALVDDAVVGGSRLNGAFSYATEGGVRKLSGRLGGSRLLLSDVGPAVGATVRADADVAVAVVPAVAVAGGVEAGDAVAGRGKLKGTPNAQPNVKPNTKVLPARPFDLQALRAMDANVLIDISDVDLNTRLLEPLRPLRAHLQLIGGVLTLSDLQARTAQGELAGLVRLDGRNTPALWNAKLRWSGVRLEQWIKQVRANGAPPWVSGRLNGTAQLQGQGKSTAEILASLKGSVRTELLGGSVSHLAVEAAGLDVAQGLGILFKGDDALSVQCGVADLAVDAGNFKPRLMVVDTSDSSVWVDGSLSLATEALDLRLVVFPKDFSPLALRTPLRLKGSFAKPEISLEKAPLARKLAASLLLGLLNPLAALIPLIDVGDAKAAADAGGGGGGGAGTGAGTANGLGCASFAKRAREGSASRR